MARPTPRPLPAIVPTPEVAPLRFDGRARTIHLTPPHGGLAQPVPLPAAPPLPAPAPSRARPATKRRGGWTLMVLPRTAGAGSVRTYELRSWQLRAAIGVAFALLASALVGGMELGTRWRDDELAALDVQLWNTQLNATALDDTLQAMRLAATLAPAAPSPAAPSRRAVPGTRSSAGASSLRLASGVVLPVMGRISSGFSLSRRHPLLMIRRPHLGIDVGAPAGTRIRAPASGRVSRVERQLGYGLMVEVDHGGGVRTRYAHCRSALVEVGDQVTQGTPIATVGSSGLSTGPHLHYEVVVRGSRVNPLRYRFAEPAVAAAPAPTIAPTSAPAPPDTLRTAAGH